MWKPAPLIPNDYLLEYTEEMYGGELNNPGSPRKCLLDWKWTWQCLVNLINFFSVINLPIVMEIVIYVVQSFAWQGWKKIMIFLK